MTASFYKLKRHRLVSGASWLSRKKSNDKFGLSVTLLRFLFIILLFTVSHAFIGVIIYLLLDTTLPYKDEGGAEKQKLKCLIMALDLVEEKEAI